MSMNGNALHNTFAFPMSGSAAEVLKYEYLGEDWRPTILEEYQVTTFIADGGQGVVVCDTSKQKRSQ